MTFKNVTPQEFDEAISESRASALFRQQYARYRASQYDGWSGPDCVVCRGDLERSGTFEAPGFFTLIVGDLTVDGLVDLHNPYDKGFDEGGLFAVIGNVTCKAFASEYGKCTFIDGDLEVDDLLLNSFGDSALIVTKDIRTYFFYGRDIWAEIGGTAHMDYGSGYCLPIGYSVAAAEAIMPVHDEKTSLARLNFADTSYIHPPQFLALLREGKSVFR